MKFRCRLVVLVDRSVEKGLAAALDLMLVLEGLEEALAGSEVGDWFIILATARREAGPAGPDAPGVDLLPAETEMPAPAMTTIFFLVRRTWSRRSRCASPASSRLSRSRCSVVRGLRSVTLRLFAGG